MSCLNLLLQQFRYLWGALGFRSVRSGAWQEMFMRVATILGVKLSAVVLAEI
jgi:hypothetical protein